ncbi:class II fructose-bisphosphate aldolase family protein [Streptomyces hygroscopicus subsp. hygroscopicus]|uniref:Fructose-bisphosphate aldolase n=1 Tax=Streptomyces hygroscopicus TaxID=1912 RepID=A0ABQ3UEK6_STRHY|nr:MULTISPECIES: class II fructose-bisphosphate aldolase [Streptomyces]MBW8088322.1 class II fructose-bisphosphate aldolase family protein [Streptomyces hygroscopicus subsp. hygroscopicus]MCO8309012.1 class II fructose-bisphosphate aldolase family protein [Streptomyces sp. RKCA744]GHJ34044.1 fructose-bisphosphate aldolase [Streptomyces hygroscopicus]
MSLVPTRELVSKAAAAGRAVAAFNVITLEHAEAVTAGAEAAGTPVILQISENAVRFHGGRVEPIARAAAEVGRGCGVDVALHLDHVTDMRLLRTAADAGFSSAMFDAGAQPYAENLAATRAAAQWAHGAGLWLEAELGYVGGKPDAPASAHAAGVRTDPEEAARYVADTGVDALAVAVGSSHAMTERSASLDHALIERLREAVPVPLVLHGSSGVGDEELRRAVRAGIVKINIGTALNVAFTGTVREALAERPDLTDPRPYLARGREAITEAVRLLLAVVSG